MTAAFANLLIVVWFAAFVPPFTWIDGAGISLCVAHLLYEIDRETGRLR